jgi:hypothetical protein
LKSSAERACAACSSLIAPRSLKASHVACPLYTELFAKLGYERLPTGFARDNAGTVTSLTYLPRQAEASYAWHDPGRVERWLGRALTKFWLRPRALIGRSAALALLGRHALTGRAPEGGEESYDMLFPIYDGSLEDVAFNERPIELRAFDWNVVGPEEKAWRQGLNANDWRHCPASIGRLHLIGERSWFVRPQWEWPREERCRGIWADPAGEAVTCDALASRVELTHEMYLRGIELDQKQILVWND